MDIKTETTEQPLFQSETVTTMEEYLKFNRYVCWVVNKQWIFALVCAIMSMAAVLISGNPVIVGVIALVIFAVLLVCILEFSGRRSYKSNQSGENERSRNMFYSKHIAELRENGSDIFEYAKLYLICENKTHFYLMIAKNKGIIIPKSTCTPELIEFIRSIKFQYGK